MKKLLIVIGMVLLTIVPPAIYAYLGIKFGWDAFPAFILTIVLALWCFEYFQISETKKGLWSTLDNRRDKAVGTVALILYLVFILLPQKAGLHSLVSSILLLVIGVVLSYAVIMIWGSEKLKGEFRIQFRRNKPEIE